jgi:hypothetical protein
VGRVAFELDRFQLVGRDRCELQGRWFGVRGRRFMRPALTVVVDGQPTRLLADLAHKPWAAEDGQPWKAAFPCPSDRGDLLDAELTVAPDITVPLPVPEGRGVARKRPHGGRRGSRVDPPAAARERGGGQDAREERPLQGQLERAQAEQRRSAARGDELARDLDRARTERDKARAERDGIATERDEAQRARDAALKAREAAIAARDQALADRGAALAAESRALSDRDAALAACDQVVSERDGALAAFERNTSDRDTERAALDQATSDRDATRAALDQAVSERDAALTARDEALRRADALSRTNERLHVELTEFLSARGAAMVMRRAAQEPASRPLAGLLPGALAIPALLAVVIALLIILRVI